jgi:hypothetical protein
MRRALAFFALSVMPVAAAQAQDVTAAPQIVGPASVDTSPQQIGERPGDTPRQLSGVDDSRPHQRQLTTVEESDEQTAQISSEPRSVQAPEPLSTPEQGRTAAIAPVEGKDRCDAANPKDSKLPECRHVIETRSAEFTRPSPTELSPEQKLLIDQQLLARESNLSTVTRRLADTGDPNSIEAMGVASVALTQNRPDEPKKPEQDAQTEAAIQAIVTVLGGQPPQ